MSFVASFASSVSSVSIFGSQGRALSGRIGRDSVPRRRPQILWSVDARFSGVYRSMRNARAARTKTQCRMMRAVASGPGSVSYPFSTRRLRVRLCGTIDFPRPCRRYYSITSFAAGWGQARTRAFEKRRPWYLASRGDRHVDANRTRGLCPWTETRAGRSVTRRRPKTTSRRARGLSKSSRTQCGITPAATYADRLQLNARETMTRPSTRGKPLGSAAAPRSRTLQAPRMSYDVTKMNIGNIRRGRVKQP
ncbi:hypothetical protein C8Q79DRAFT_43488 [Trametes meyenii]|nr:hypothetical protein C8Q79DRAFT_43488 [Trametes meyenii]